MNNNNGIAKNDCDWLTALDFVKDVNGSPTHLTFYIYQKNAFLHDFGNYWVLYIELSGDFSSGSNRYIYQTLQYPGR